MDPKKQNLTPELKQIYDRVMNTQMNKPQGQPLSQSTTSPSAQSQNPAAQPTNQQTTSPDQQPPPAQQSGATHAPGQTGAQEFLSSAPPRPLTDTKPLVFTGNKISMPEKKDEQKKIIGLLVVVLVIAWGLFWAKFFGLI